MYDIYIYILSRGVKGREDCILLGANESNPLCKCAVLNVRDYTKNACYLNAQVEQPDPEPIAGDKWIGVDLGINNIAVCSDNTFWQSGPVKAVKGKYQYLRSKIQSIGTRSAKRNLQIISGQERRFQKGTNHQIANWILFKPYDTIALEDLTHIRSGKRNKKLGKWSFAELRSIIEYKATTIGKKVAAIDPRYTSWTCSKCGFQKKENRNGRNLQMQELWLPDRRGFECIQEHLYIQ
jgi:putative transposase